MANELQTVLDGIKLDKDTNLLPENLKAGITCLGVNGTLTPGSSTTEGVKLFETKEQMQVDATAKENDLAMVYRSEIQNAKVDSKFSKATFPKTVVLDTAITDYVDVRYRATDTSKMFDCMGSLDSSSFRMNCYGDSGEVRIRYESSDGLTYTRTTLEGQGVNGDEVDFGTELYYEYTEMWNDAIGKFIQVGGSTFEGLYKYGTVPTEDGYLFLIDNLDCVIKIPTLERPSFLSSGKTYITFIIKNVELDTSKLGDLEVYVPKDYYILYNNVLSDSGSEQVSARTILQANDKTTIYGNNYKDTIIAEQAEAIGVYIEQYKNKVLTNSKSYTNSTLLTMRQLIKESTENWKDYIFDFDILADEDLSTCGVFEGYFGYNSNIFTLGSGFVGRTAKASFNGNITSLPISSTFSVTSVDTYTTILNYHKYIIAPSQLTLSSPNELLPNVIAYGREGVVISDGSITQPNSNFTDIPSDLYSQIQLQYNEMEPRVLTDTDREIDKNLYIVPTKTDGTSLWDTSNITNMGDMFYNCKNLMIVPQLDTSSATDMGRMFYICPNLVNVPLLNTSKVTNMNSMFGSCTKLTTIPLLDTSQVTNMGHMFNGCSSLTTIPPLNTSSVTNMDNLFNNCGNLINVPALDTSNVTTMMYMFYYCKNLETIPLFNTGKVVTMYLTFGGCSKLNDESLNTILQMCTNSAIKSSKTLKNIGLTSEQATRCQSLSNYSAFTSAGWTTGY